MTDERYIVIKVAYDRYPSYGRSLAWVAPELREAGLSMVENHSLAPSPSRTWAGSVDGPTFERFADAWHLDASSSVTDEEQAAAREYTFDGMNWEAGGESPIVYVRVRVGVKHEAGAYDSRRPRRRSAGSSRSRADPRACRSVMRRGRAGSRCGGF